MSVLTPYLRVGGNAHPMASLAVVSSVLGTLGLITPLPSLVRGPAALLYAFAGPGAAIMLWMPEVSGALRRTLVPVLSMAAMIIVSYLAVLQGLWHPQWQLALMIVATLASVAVFNVRNGRLPHPDRADGRTEEVLR
jgi:peptidoglycan/LPS O-acetylase OafA/YrhL